MGLQPNKPIISWEYYNLKMHLIPLCGVPVVDSHVHMVDWELWLTAIAQYHERVLYRISLAQEKTKRQNLKHDFYWIHIAFAAS